MKFPLQGRRRPRLTPGPAPYSRGRLRPILLSEDAIKCQGIATSLERGGCVMKITIARGDMGECLRLFNREGRVVLLSPLCSQHSEPPVFEPILLRRLRRIRPRILWRRTLQWMSCHSDPLEKGRR